MLGISLSNSFLNISCCGLFFFCTVFHWIANYLIFCFCSLASIKIYLNNFPHFIEYFHFSSSFLHAIPLFLDYFMRFFFFFWNSVRVSKQSFVLWMKWCSFEIHFHRRHSSIIQNQNGTKKKQRKIYRIFAIKKINKYQEFVGHHLGLLSFPNVNIYKSIIDGSHMFAIWKEEKAICCCSLCELWVAASCDRYT